MLLREIMQLWQLLTTIFCSAGILMCLVYIVYQLHKQRLEIYAQEKIAEHVRIYGPRPYQPPKKSKRNYNKNN